jgi:hypothetical protein
MFILSFILMIVCGLFFSLSGSEYVQVFSYIVCLYMLEIQLSRRDWDPVNQLKTGGQQFYLNKQNEQTPLTSTQ